MPIVASDIKIDHIHPNPRNPRRTINPEYISELAASIKTQGLIQPITVRPHPTIKKQYQIVVGERRWRACQEAELDAIHCIIRDMNDREVAEAMLVENLQRVDVDPIEEARYVDSALSQGMTPAEVGARLGKSPKWVAIRIQIASMAEAILELVRNGSIGIAHVQALAQVKDTELRLQLASSAAEDKMTVSELHAEIQKHQRKLADAPWKMTVKLGKCPACLGCADRSDRQGDLFGGEKNALCLNSSCWVEKLEAHKQALKEKLEAQGRKVEIANPSLIWQAQNGYGGFVKNEEEVQALKDAGVKPWVLIDPDGATIEAYNEEDAPEQESAGSQEDAEAQAERERLDRERRLERMQEEIIRKEIGKKLEADEELTLFCLVEIILDDSFSFDEPLRELCNEDEDGRPIPLRKSEHVSLLKVRKALAQFVAGKIELDSELLSKLKVSEAKAKKEAVKQLEKEQEGSDDE